MCSVFLRFAVFLWFFNRSQIGVEQFVLQRSHADKQKMYFAFQKVVKI